MFSVTYTIMPRVNMSNSVKTRIQASTGEGREKLSLVSVILRILREDGFAGYYRGFMATMINTFSMRTFPLSPPPPAHI